MDLAEVAGRISERPTDDLFKGMEFRVGSFIESAGRVGVGDVYTYWPTTQAWRSLAVVRFPKVPAVLPEARLGVFLLTERVTKDSIGRAAREDAPIVVYRKADSYYGSLDPWDAVATLCDEHVPGMSELKVRLEARGIDTKQFEKCGPFELPRVAMSHGVMTLREAHRAWALLAIQ